MTTIHTYGTRLSREVRSRVCDGDSIRALIADQLGVDVKRVSDQTHLARDLGVDWLNRLELVIFVEDQTGLELDDDDVELIEVVGDLIRLFESAEAQRQRWAATKRRSVPSLQIAPQRKRRLSAAGRKRIIEATKRRWALKRAELVKAQGASAKKGATGKGAARRAAA